MNASEIERRLRRRPASAGGTGVEAAGRRGARPPKVEAGPSWERDPSLLGEHAAGLAQATIDSCYRWIRPAVGGANCLDVGSGAGGGIVTLLEAGAASATGISSDPGELETATRAHGERASFVLAEPIALPLSSQSFGAVLCFSAATAAREPEAVLGELVRVLEPDGLLAVRLPIATPIYPVTGKPPQDPREADHWRRLLERGFKHVRLHRHRSGFGAGVLPEGDADTVAEAIWLDHDPEDEWTILALAANRPLPELKPTMSLTGSRDLQAYKETIAAWEHRARRAEADGAAKHWELVASREAQRRLRKRLWHLEHTPLRKLVRMLRGRPAKLNEGPPVRPPENPPESWD
jgi:SAM-dependent methyltransferase